MHGCGNDFVVFDERAAPLGLTPARAAAIAHRRTGVGCDQFIVIEPPPTGSNADVFMRIRNPDGAEIDRQCADFAASSDLTPRWPHWQ